jgi:lipopolysaccharide export system protein LptA
MIRIGNFCDSPEGRAFGDRICAWRALILLCTMLPLPLLAERADRDKPTNIEAARMVADDTRRTSTFEGGVVVTKGTMSLTAERLIVRQDSQGSYKATATGTPVRFRQRTDAKGDRPAAWVDGEAMRIELDDREQKVELFEKARVVRDMDEVRGDYIFLDQRSETFTVSSGRDQAGGRVRAVLQPKTGPAEQK